MKYYRITMFLLGSSIVIYVSKVCKYCNTQYYNIILKYHGIIYHHSAFFANENRGSTQLLKFLDEISKRKGQTFPPPVHSKWLDFIQGFSRLKSLQKKLLNAAVSRKGIMGLPI